MGVLIVEDLLRLPTVGQPIYYTLETRTRLRVPQGAMQYAGTTTARQTVVAVKPSGYTVEIVTLAQHQNQPNALAELLLDIAHTNSPLQAETDVLGNLLRIANKTELRAQWQEAQPWLQAKYQALPASAQVLAQVAAQYQDDNDYLERALLGKGLCGMLLPGFLGLPTWNTAPQVYPKLVPQFFRTGDLPLQVTWVPSAEEPLARTADVVGTGVLDHARFDVAGFWHLLAGLTAEPPARPAALQVHWQAHYTASRTGQGLLAGYQRLWATVPGLFAHETEHTLHLTPPTP